MLPQASPNRLIRALFIFSGMLGLKPKNCPRRGLDVGQTGLGYTGEWQLIELEQDNAGSCQRRSTVWLSLLVP